MGLMGRQCFSIVQTTLGRLQLALAHLDRHRPQHCILRITFLRHSGHITEAGLIHALLAHGLGCLHLFNDVNDGAALHLQALPDL